MEHFIKIAFCIFTLLHSLQTTPLPPSSDANIQFLREKVKCLPDSKFYSPTNVKKECITTALDCFLKELYGAVQLECEDKTDIIKTMEYLENQTENKTLSDSPDCICETSPELPFIEFVDKLESVIEMYTILQNVKT